MNVEARKNGTEEPFLFLFLQGRGRDADVEKGHVNTVGGG